MPFEQIGEKFSLNFLILIGISIIILTYLISTFKKRLLIKKLKPISDAMNGKIIIKVFSNPYIKIPGYESEVRIIITSGGKDSPPSLFIKWSSPLRFNLFITKENILTKTLQRWIKEVKVGEQSFDDEYYIRSDNQKQTAFFLKYPERREAMKYFFDNEFNYIKADKNGVTVGKILNWRKDQNPENINSYLQELRKFVLAED